MCIASVADCRDGAIGEDSRYLSPRESAAATAAGEGQVQPAAGTNSSGPFSSD